MIDFELISQAMIFITGVSALSMLSSVSAKDRMIAGSIGLAGEPFWFYTLIVHEQWVVAALALVYTLQWIRIIKNNHREWKRISYGLIG